MRNEIIKNAESNKNKKIWFVVVGYLIVVIILTYLLPYNILDRFTFLNRFVRLMSNVFPPIYYFGIHSDFRQISQLIYSIEIVSFPILTVIFHRLIGFNLNNERFSNLLKKPFIYFVLLPIILLGIVLGPLFFYPRGPSLATHILIFITACYHSKIIFSLATVCLFWTSIYCFLIFIGLFRGLFTSFLKNNI